MPIRVEPHAEPIPGYKLIERLGGGGFGEVWKAEAPGGLLKAIKFVYGDMQTMGEASQRADQELKALKRVATVRHPYVLSLERFDIIDGRLMIVMELADRNLWDRFRECRGQSLPGIPRDELLGYMQETAEALDLMNTQYQLQHLDIKPQNIFLIQNHIKVADFGLVKDLQDRMAATITGGVTPVYAAPETFDGWVSRFCDQYSLAIVFQELLTGQRPFGGNNVHQLVMQHVQGKPNLNALTPADRAAVSRALAKNPDDRYPSCSEFIRTLRCAGEARGPAAPPGEPATLSPSPEGPLHPAPPRMESAGADFNTTARAPLLAKRDARRPQTLAAENSQEEPAPPSSEVPSVEGDGQLVPALIVGVGQTGLTALRQVNGTLQDRFGSLAGLPHLRLLYLDTDPDSTAAATEAAGTGALERRAVLTARLNRPSFYLNPRKGRPPLNDWFDSRLLYRIQRHQVTGGVRALGRLAFFTHYRAIAQWLMDELAACADPDALGQADKETGLGIRSNQPRVYVVTSLAGGTGSGVFIDLAYVIRDQLQKLGFREPEVVGLVVLPPADPKLSRPRALGNTFAGLTEIHHFASPETVFRVRYQDREPTAPKDDGAITVEGPPFTRCLLLPATPESPEGEGAARLAGEFLCQELFTPLGRLTDELRLSRTRIGPAGTTAFQTVGLFRYTWPRRALLQGASRRLCRNLVQRWLSKDAKPVQEGIQAFVQDQWTELGLGAEALIDGFREACEGVIGREPEAAFAALMDPLVGPGRQLSAGDREAVQRALGEVERLVGRPSDSTVLNRPGDLEEVIRAHGETLTAAWQDTVARFTLDLVDRPEWRFVGAEEGIRQAVRLIEQSLASHETLAQELTEKAAKSYERLCFLVANYREIFRGRRTPQLVAELSELLQRYPKWRYQSLVLRRVILANTSLRGYLSDQVREIGYYRLRIGELLSAFGQSARPASAAELTGTLYPPACDTIDEAVEHLFPQATAGELETLDRRMQALIEEQFISLRHVCATPTLPLRRLELAMLGQAEALVTARLAETNAGSAFFDIFPGDAAAEAVSHALEKAVPCLSDSNAVSGHALAVVAVPAGQEDSFRSLAVRTAPDVQVVATPNPDDLVFYCEAPQVVLAELPQAGPAAQEAYRQMLGAENFAPHSRIDIAQWRELKAEGTLSV